MSEEDHLIRSIEVYFQSIGIEIDEVQVDEEFEYVYNSDIYPEPEVVKTDMLIIKIYFSTSKSVGTTKVSFSQYYDGPGRYDTIIGDYMKSDWQLGVLDDRLGLSFLVPINFKTLAEQVKKEQIENSSKILSQVR